MHAEQVSSVGAADPQDRLFPAQRTGQHAARVRGEDRRQQSTGESEEDEHALGRSGVIAGHLKCIGDVVDQDVLPGRDGIDGVGDSLGLG